ncbi:MAG: hypothetical protein V8Q57_09445 [Blautia sp.]
MQLQRFHRREYAEGMQNAVLFSVKVTLQEEHLEAVGGMELNENGFLA